MKKLYAAVLTSSILLFNLVGQEKLPVGSPQKFTLELTDGSSLIGGPLLTSIEIQTGLGKMDVPVQKIQNLTMDRDQQTTLLLLENGDKLTGHLSLKNFKVATILGDLDVNMALLRQMTKFNSEDQIVMSLLDSPEKKRQMGNTILNECRQVDAAKDQYALENNKTGMITPDWKDLTPYLRAGSELTKNGGKDSLGNPFMINAIQEMLKVNPKTKEILKDATDGYLFWGPYS